jgi:hypothetical protein
VGALRLPSQPRNSANGKLQRLNLIQYARGHMMVLDRPCLERHVCECYEVVKRETDRLLFLVMNPGPTRQEWLDALPEEPTSPTGECSGLTECRARFG